MHLRYVRRRPRRLTLPELDRIALLGSVEIWASHVRGLNDATFDITVREGDQLRIGTTIHDEALVETLGRVAAEAVREQVRRGTYYLKLSGLEVLGLRGDLARRIARADWTHPEMRLSSRRRPRQLRASA